VRASPLARKIAAELGVDLSRVQGTGPGGAIERADVEQAAAAKAPPKPAAAARTSIEFQAGMRRAIAAAMSKSNRESPHYYLQTRIDMSAALHWLEEENRKRSMKERLLPAVLTLRAVARALRDVPELNGFWIDEKHQPSDAIHIGFAIAMRGGGLVTPAIHDADRKSVDELMAALRDVIDRTRGGRLRASEMSDPTITLTNLGDLGAESVLGVIYPPQVALVGFGRITEQPWAANGLLGVRPIVNASLAGDHRATDGHRGAQFLDALNRHLQEPEKPWP
jgi:pyruvate dehydrogenase E2 component (dihydrolipoamide acetyltransferase)